VIIPSIRDMESKVAQLRRDLDDLLEDYRWAHNTAHSKPTRGEPRRGSDVSDPTSGAASMGVYVRASGGKVQTGGLVKACHDAIRRVGAASEEIDSAIGILTKALDRLDSHATEPIGPRLASPSDLVEARAAKDRRESRGEGWGSG
jgi:hypothetical protein